ncbi:MULTISPECIES: OsmC family protein [Pseudanabaena]|uniref:OsmC family protein n=2 Tax=Pseudanabaena TaxID=1152 RepID=L8N6H7_9CYAN|nr:MULTISPECIES: OsmC family protein [Pseudanabaena]ELS34300.1 OsmC family protein [Pseudanabaena biceps PCC 7429]MDG3493524.1 OsmC family protein [Pseudanabaena catenata USMAC16]
MTETLTITQNVLRPVSKTGLENLAANAKANPNVIKSIKVKTVCEGQFRNLTYVRDLPEHVIDEPPSLLGQDTAPNPSEAVLAALGSCLSVGIHANAIVRGITLTKLELELEGDINITGVWGIGDLSEKRLGFTDIRAKVNLEGNVSRAELEDLVAHSNLWSPVANTLRNPVNLDVALAE